MSSKGMEITPEGRVELDVAPICPYCGADIWIWAESGNGSQPKGSVSINHDCNDSDIEIRWYRVGNTIENVQMAVRAFNKRGRLG